MIRHIAQAAGAVVFGTATIVVIGTCVVQGLRANDRPRHSEPERSGRTKPSDPSPGDSAP